MSDKEAVETIASIIYEAMRFDRESETPEWQGGNSIAETEARAKAVRVIAAARPHILEEAARIAEAYAYSDDVTPGAVKQMRDRAHKAMADDEWEVVDDKDAKHKNWFFEQRMEWIAETLRVFGFLNRAHIERKFWISTPQASVDIQEFQKRHPDAMTYDKSAKQYVAIRAARGNTGDQ